MENFYLRTDLAIKGERRNIVTYLSRRNQLTYLR
jgi:hypothetical protein